MKRSMILFVLGLGFVAGCGDLARNPVGPDAVSSVAPTVQALRGPGPTAQYTVAFGPGGVAKAAAQTLTGVNDATHVDVKGPHTAAIDFAQMKGETCVGDSSLRDALAALAAVNPINYDELWIDMSKTGDLTHNHVQWTEKVGKKTYKVLFGRFAGIKVTSDTTNTNDYFHCVGGYMRIQTTPGSYQCDGIGDIDFSISK